MDEKDERSDDLVVGSDGSINEGAEGTNGSMPEVESPDNSGDDETSEAQTVEVKTETPEAPDLSKVAEEIAAAPAEGIQVEVKQPPAEESETPASEESPVEEVVEITPPPEAASETDAPAPDPVSEGVVSDQAASEDTDSASPNAIEPDTAVSPSTEQPADSVAATPRPEPHGNKKLAVIVTLVVAFLLAGIAIYLYVSAQNNTKEVDDTAQQVNSEQSEPTGTDETTQTAPTTSEDQLSLDAQHKNNAAKLVSAVNEYAANNNGNLPAVTDIDGTFVTQYLSGAFNDPSTSSPYSIVETDPGSGEMQYSTGSTCDSNNMIVSGNSREVAVRVLLIEGSYYCLAS